MTPGLRLPKPSIDQQLNLTGDGTGMQGTLKRWRETLWRLRRADLPDFEPGEEILLDGRGTLVRYPPLNGRLTLTNQRLIFRTDPVKYLPVPPIFMTAVDVWMVNVAAVTQQSWLKNVWRGFPGVLQFAVTSTANVTYTFRVVSADPWVETIRKHAPHLPKMTPGALQSP